MRALIYTKDNCPYCVKAKALLHTKGADIMEVKIGTDITREEFIQVFPTQKTVPLIFIDEQKIGGYNELSEHFDRNSATYLAG